MDFIRVLKLKLILDDGSSDEKTTFFYSMLDKLEAVDNNDVIYLVLVSPTNSYRYYDPESCKHYFHYHKKSGNFWTNVENVLDPICDKFKLDYNEAMKLVYDIAHKDFKIKK